MAQRCVLEIRPIEDAPIRQGEKFGPCVLWPGPNGQECVTGEFDGYDWFTLTLSTRINPRFYASLLTLTELTALFSGVASSAVAAP